MKDSVLIDQCALIQDTLIQDYNNLLKSNVNIYITSNMIHDTC